MRFKNPKVTVLRNGTVQWNMPTRDQQELMNQAYYVWNYGDTPIVGETYSKRNGPFSKMSMDDILEKHFSEIHKAAVLMGNFNYQVGNGGVSQWIFNGYAQHAVSFLEDLYSRTLRFPNLPRKFKEQAEAGHKLLKKVITTADPDDDSWECTCSSCEGSGSYYEWDEEEGDTEETCDDCGGSGEMDTSDYFDAFEDVDFDQYETDFYKSLSTNEELMQYILDNYENITSYRAREH